VNFVADKFVKHTIPMASCEFKRRNLTERSVSELNVLFLSELFLYTTLLHDEELGLEDE